MFPQTDKENWQDFGLFLCSSLWHLPGLVVSKENTYLSHAAQKRLHPSGPRRKKGCTRPAHLCGVIYQRTRL